MDYKNIVAGVVHLIKKAEIELPYDVIKSLKKVYKVEEGIAKIQIDNILKKTEETQAKPSPKVVFEKGELAGVETHQLIIALHHDHLVLNRKVREQKAQGTGRDNNREQKDGARARAGSGGYWALLKILEPTGQKSKPGGKPGLNQGLVYVIFYVCFRILRFKSVRI
jgi:hypothetical protein